MTYSKWKDKIFEVYANYVDSGRLGDAVLAVRAECQQHLDLTTTECRLTCEMVPDSIQFAIDVFVTPPGEPLAILAHERLSPFTLYEWGALNSLMLEFDVPPQYLN